MEKRKVFLIIMDGWGYSTVKDGNAIVDAKTPNFDHLWQNYPHTLLNAFGENVGLPWGAIGSSEIGHSSIGSGKLIHQELSLIDKEIIDEKFYQNQKINKFVRESFSGDIHLIGLVSHGGVHSHLSHLYALLKLLKRADFQNNIYIHAITDGRDTSPKSAKDYLSELDKKISSINNEARIATVIGRYYAMDRDSRWDRTLACYRLLTEAKGQKYRDYKEAIDDNYRQNINDEFIKPSLLNISSKRGLLQNIFGSKTELFFNGIKENDGVIFFNTRPDRMRQIVETFLFKKKDIDNKLIKNIKILTLTTYDEYLPVEVAYPVVKTKNTLASILSENGLSQGHFAETEKYAHVTYFFNGGNPKPHKNEVWELVPSPKVTTYDKTPEMSADKITDRVIELTDKKNLDFILINYANADMVGHTGVYKSVVGAVETVDRQLGRLLAHYPNDTIIITADHGNAESMIHPKTGEVNKMHTVNPVPFIIYDEQHKIASVSKKDIEPSAILADITPTVLSLFNIAPNKDMNGVDLSKSLFASTPTQPELKKVTK